MKKRTEKETDILIEGKETQKLSQFIPLKKLKTFLSVYNFINNFKVEKHRLPNYPCDEISAIYTAINKLLKGGWIREGCAQKIRDELMLSLLEKDMSLSLKFDYWKGKEKITYRKIKKPLPDYLWKVLSKMESEKAYHKLQKGGWIGGEEKCIIRKKGGRPPDDAFNILIFLLISHLIKSPAKKPRYALIDNFLQENGIKEDKDFDAFNKKKESVKEKTSSVDTLRTQIKRLNSDKLKKIYDIYYDKSVEMEPIPGKGVMLYKTLPEWEELLSQ